ncbi:MAG: caspase family protein [Oscillatoriales cyanobacterium]|nr:MAG: caspase family protein [Oscillatoriales cyanobacterium]
MALSRRDFLERSGAALVGWGLAEAIALQQATRLLAEPAGRRQALLVGINAYSSACVDGANQNAALTGCLNDVALLRDLLVDRLGFAAADVHVLTDTAATRSQWQAALQELADTTRASDGLWLHFSGYGGQLASDGTALLVPVDGELVAAAAQPIRDWAEPTLQAWLRALPTERAIGTIDAGIAPIAPGWLPQRSRPQATLGCLDPEEVLWQQALRKTARSRGSGGLWLRATTPDRQALELSQAGFTAGAWTYLLAQHLWNGLPPKTLWFELAQVAAAVESQVGKQQQPIGERLIRSAIDMPRGFDWLTIAQPAACGSIVAIDPQANTWDVALAGLPAIVLESVAAGSILETTLEPNLEPTLKPTLETTDADLPQLARVVSSHGWRAIAQPLSPDELAWVIPGQGLRERWRTIPRNLSLTVALDPTFERIERIDATSAFDAIPNMTVLAAGTKAIDVWFGRSGSARRDNKATDPNAASGGYRLFSAGQSWRSSAGGEGGEALKGEALKTVVQRSIPQLQAALARKLLRATVNRAAGFPLRLSLAAADAPDRPIAQISTPTAIASPVVAPVAIGTPTLPASGRPCLTLENTGDQPLSLLVLQLDPTGHLWADTAADRRWLQPNDRQSLSWASPGGRGMGAIWVVASWEPLDRVRSVLPVPEEGDGWLPLSQPLSIARMLLDELHQLSNLSTDPARPTAPDLYALHCGRWATLELAFRWV